MKKYSLAALVLASALGTACAAAPGPAVPAIMPAAQLKPGPRDLCPVCGMLVSKYPNWTAVAHYRDGHAHYFDGPKDLFKFLNNLARFAPGRHADDLDALFVTEFYGLTRVDARRAYYVVGSDVLGPMGHELVPLETLDDAREFLGDHKGRRILGFGQVNQELLLRLDAGKFD